VGSQYSSHYLVTWCIQHYYRWREVRGKLANGVGSQYSSHYLGTWCIQHYYRWREVKGKLVNGVGSQYSSHYLGTWCIQHYYRWCAHLGCQSTELTPLADLNGLVRFGERRNLVPARVPSRFKRAISLFVWRLPFDLPSKGSPASSYATACIALRVTGVLKPPDHDKVEPPARRSDWILSN